MKRPNAWNALLGATLLLGGTAALSYSAAAAEAEGDVAKARTTVKVEKLSDLRDGETRTFGEGEHRVEATRRGDEVTIQLHGADEAAVKNFNCNLSTDRCTVVTTGGTSPRTTVMVNKSKETDGKTEAFVHKIVIAGDRGDGTVVVEGDDPHALIEDLDDLAGLPMMARAHGDQVMLRCPQGDTHMWLSKDEAKTASYRCPRHDEELKETKGERQVVRIIRHHDRADDAKK